MSVVRERALLLASGSQEWVPPVPRPASTLVLIRDGDEGVETFLMRRPLSMRFAPGMSVYPGGALDESDFDAEITREDKDILESTDPDLYYRWIRPRGGAATAAPG